MYHTMKYQVITNYSAIELSKLAMCLPSPPVLEYSNATCNFPL
jgi:hypothetical protein